LHACAISSTFREYPEQKIKKTTFVHREENHTNATILNISGWLQSFIVKLYIYKKDIREDIRPFGL